MFAFLQIIMRLLLILPMLYLKVDKAVRRKLEKLATETAILWLTSFKLLDVYEAMSEDDRIAFVYSFAFRPRVTREEILDAIRNLNPEGQ